MKKTTILIALAVMLLASAAAAENITELKIESITTPIRAGETLEFSYLIGNNLGPPCSAKIQYWFEADGERLVQGNDTVYLETGERKVESASLIMPPGPEGTRNFYLEMQCNEATGLASRIIHISTEIPKLPQFKTLDITQAEEDGQTTFSYSLESSQGETVPVNLEEQIVSDGNVVWANSQSVAVTGETEIKGFGPLLPPGSYKLTVEASHGAETAIISRDFSVKASAVPPPLPILPIVALVLVMALVGFTALRYFTAKRPYPKQKILTGRVLQADKEKRIVPVRDSICLVESESSGVLKEEDLSNTLDLAGIEGGKRMLAMEFAGKTNVMQTVKSCIVIGKDKKAKFETRIQISIANNGNRNWTGLVAIARTPGFLGQQISDVSADVKLEAFQDRQIIRFNVKKISAMHSATIVYTVPKLISQEEANTVPLPAVIEFEESEPLVVTQVKVQKEDRQVEKVSLPKKKAVKKRRERKKKTSK